MKHSTRNLSRVIAVAIVASASLNMPAVAYDPPRAASADLVSMLNARLAPNIRPAFYQESTSGKRFLLDRTGPHALLQYEGDSEVFALHASNGPRGDQFYRTDTSRLFLRVTELGNVIVFPLGDRQGTPASLDAASSAIIPPPHPADLDAEINLLSTQLRAVIGVVPSITIASGLADYADWTLEAAQTASKGIELAQSHENTGLRAISFQMGNASGLAINDGSLQITIKPADGFAGRPSSEAVAKALLSAR